MMINVMMMMIIMMMIQVSGAEHGDRLPAGQGLQHEDTQQELLYAGSPGQHGQRDGAGLQRVAREGRRGGRRSAVVGQCHDRRRAAVAVDTKAVGAVVAVV